jgi:4-amino-4-deoxychorismate lyase
MTAAEDRLADAEPILLETIKLKDGVYYNLRRHSERIKAAYRVALRRAPDFALQDVLPEPNGPGLYRVRISYPCGSTAKVEVLPYSFPKLKSLKLICDETLEYSHKYLDRSPLAALKDSCGADDFVITRNGSLTDSSIANVVLENKEGFFTPKLYLLGGVKRSFLLDARRISVRDIGPDDLKNYQKLYFINAMIDLEDDVSVPTEAIVR